MRKGREVVKKFALDEVAEETPRGQRQRVELVLERFGGETVRMVYSEIFRNGVRMGCELEVVDKQTAKDLFSRRQSS